MKRIVPVLICFFIFGSGCSVRQMVSEWSLPLVADQVESMRAESDLILARESIPSNLKIMEGLLKGDPKNVNLLEYLAEGFCSYAFSYVRDEDPARASVLYARGKDYALRALDQPQMAGLPPAEFAGAIEGFGAKRLPALFWLGQCWGEWLTLNLSSPSAFADISKLEILLTHNVKLDEDYRQAGPHLGLGVFYGNRSRMLGGNPEKAKEHFQRNIELTGGKYLLSYYFYAKTVAVQTQDRELFESLLRTALSAPPEALPEERLANEVAQRKAKALLEEADDLF
ncbi:MAG: hypothetical protein G3M78_08410 [Candidatus Nitrohelix vancouverensis]|uniref:Lipoprotein n=1 Tax=Candidatus Nitrohelix vancouverensis TaxID=2705534 RepID=A0A7T0C2N5_9BACT|nr:MAG: hypothetical protein G3M78_08410 [Candidatus Nitrohelix vancouverensis]